MTVIVSFILAGVRKKVNVYDAFIEGAKDGFKTAVVIIPYLVAILVGIGVFRASSAMDMLIDGLAWCVEALGIDTQFIGALPTALMKHAWPVSSKARQTLPSTCWPFTSVA